MKKRYPCLMAAAVATTFAMLPLMAQGDLELSDDLVDRFFRVRSVLCSLAPLAQQPTSTWQVHAPIAWQLEHSDEASEAAKAEGFASLTEWAESGDCFLAAFHAREHTARLAALRQSAETNAELAVSTRYQDTVSSLERALQSLPPCARNGKTITFVSDHRAELIERFQQGGVACVQPAASADSAQSP